MNGSSARKKKGKTRGAGSGSGILTVAAVLFFVALLALGICLLRYETDTQQDEAVIGDNDSVQLDKDLMSKGTVILSPGDIPDFSGTDYITLNNNEPNFNDYDKQYIRGEHYSALDRLGRCGAACARIDNQMMPSEERGFIGMIRPSGWHTVKYPGVIEDDYLYNRCHLIAYALTGQNSNERNLITGTRYMNSTSMLPFEIEVMDYLDKTTDHVLYRVTPFFKGDELVARGVEMEAYSLEDEGQGLCYHVFVYNYQPGIGIDYETGDSWVLEDNQS